MRAMPAVEPIRTASSEPLGPCTSPPLVEPILVLELPRQVLLREVLEVLVGERVELVLESARKHPLDLLLPRLLLEPLVVQQLLGARDVAVVELDADVPRQRETLGVGARKPDELGLGDRHPL